MLRKSKKGKRGIRYSKEKKAEILAAATKDKLTGAQVAKKFGISTLTFYRWRGPVRKAAISRRGRKRGPGRPKGSGKVKVDASAIRRAVQAQIRKMLPRIIREEVAAALGESARR